MASSQLSTSLIASRTTQCVDLFERLDELSRQPDRQRQDIIPKTDAVDSLGRFNIWAGNIGAFQRFESKSSLDYRLRDARKISTQIVALLDDLAESLEDACLIVSNERENRTSSTLEIDKVQADLSGDEDLQDEEELSEIKEIFSSITDSINSLFRFSIIIRNNTNRDRYAKATAASLGDPISHQFDVYHVREKFPALERNGKQWLIDRLGRAITQRRQYLKYCRDHHQKTSADFVTSTIQTLSKEPEIPLVQSATKTHTLSGMSTLSKTPSTLAQTQASTLILNSSQTVEEGEPEESQSQTSYATSNDEDNGNSFLHVVPLEDVSKGSSHFECPYCWQIQAMTTQRAWKKHVLSDLKPYVCTYEGCDMKLFSDRHTWFSHELKDHRREWYCRFCTRQPFDSIAKYEEHLSNRHPQSFTQDQLPALMEMSQHSLGKVSPSDCPFCDGWEQRLRSINTHIPLSDTLVVTQVQFKHHVGTHMEQLALFAVPRDYTEAGDAISENAAPGSDLSLPSSESDDLVESKEATDLLQCEDLMKKIMDLNYIDDVFFMPSTTGRLAHLGKRIRAKYPELPGQAQPFVDLSDITRRLSIHHYTRPEEVKDDIDRMFGMFYSEISQSSHDYVQIKDCEKRVDSIWTAYGLPSKERVRSEAEQPGPGPGPEAETEADRLFGVGEFAYVGDRIYPDYSVGDAVAAQQADDELPRASLKIVEAGESLEKVDLQPAAENGPISVTAAIPAPGATKARLRETVESYMSNSNTSKLDGGIHPAFDTTLGEVSVALWLREGKLTSVRHYPNDPMTPTESEHAEIGFSVKGEEAAREASDMNNVTSTSELLTGVPNSVTRTREVMNEENASIGYSVTATGRKLGGPLSEFREQKTSEASASLDESRTESYNSTQEADDKSVRPGVVGMCFLEHADKACGICTENYQAEEWMRTLPCGHDFHRSCIDPWLREGSRACPVCFEAGKGLRQSGSPSSLHAYYPETNQVPPSTTASTSGYSTEKPPKRKDNLGDGSSLLQSHASVGPLYPETNQFPRPQSISFYSELQQVRDNLESRQLEDTARQSLHPGEAATPTQAELSKPKKLLPSRVPLSESSSRDLPPEETKKETLRVRDMHLVPTKRVERTSDGQPRPTATTTYKITSQSQPRSTYSSTIDNADMYMPSQERLPVHRAIRHADTVADDYGDNGYGYTNPRDLVQYDLNNPPAKTAFPIVVDSKEVRAPRRSSFTGNERQGMSRPIYETRAREPSPSARTRLEPVQRPQKDAIYGTRPLPEELPPPSILRKYRPFNVTKRKTPWPGYIGESRELVVEERRPGADEDEEASSVAEGSNVGDITTDYLLQKRDAAQKLLDIWDSGEKLGEPPQEMAEGKEVAAPSLESVSTEFSQLPSPIAVKSKAVNFPERPAVKGILRKPREKFPEDPEPIREVVAPLRDSAKKDGIPPDARWTKISRKLVNPEALKLGKERFEAREDFVIVLRVLGREEIQGYAEVTQRLRATRDEQDALEHRHVRRTRRERQKKLLNVSLESGSDDGSAYEGDRDTEKE